ncbi:MAG: carboxylesterase family protein, partial [Gammaproteobacteria bacterium]|nr:carboxylesterase family protein [Gammaproteobacteria bacterium]
TRSGPIAGGLEDGLRVFRGVPFAAPPTGARRWRPPGPVASWEGIRPAGRFGPVCPQPRGKYPDWAEKHIDAVGMSEDCLTLNVWAPADGGPYPVMVYFHGGNMQYGSGSLPMHDGSVLARNGLVVVTINYRVGFLGRFAHPALTRTQPGEPLVNYGVMDQIAALGWVRDNIAAFGGDPSRVTIFGHSAGGVSVNVLMVTPASRGLFHRAIAQGSAISVDRDRHCFQPGIPGAQGRSWESIGIDFSGHFGLSGADAAVAAGLRSLSSAAIIEYQQSQLIGFNPCVDGTLVPDHVAQMFERGEQHDVPYIGGANNWEWNQIADVPLIGKWFLAGGLLEGLSDEDLAVFGDQWTRIGVSQRWFAEGLFLLSTRHLAKQMAQVSSPAYLYHITYVQSALRGVVPGAAHGMEVPFIFGVLETRPEINRPQPVKLTAEDFAWGDQVRAYWVNFAKTGDPNGTGLPHWPAYRPESDQAMVLGERIAPQAELYKDTLDYLERRALARRQAWVGDGSLQGTVP